MNHKYQNFAETMHVPAEWNERVLAAVREMPERKPMCRFWPAAACAAMALAMVLVVMVTLQGKSGDNPLAERVAPAGNLLAAPETLAFSGAEPCANGAVFLPSLTAEETVRLHGTTQTLSLTFLDGTEGSGTYSLQEEKVAAFFAADGTQVLAPVLAGDPSETVTGLYAVSETESRWLCWPVEGANTVSLSAPYGLRGSFFHSGIDIPAEQGAVVTAAAAGTVKAADFVPDRGNYLILDHGDGMETVYAHCFSLSVKAGDRVEEGREIATVGSTGMATGPHLHFEVQQDGEPQNPVAYFEAEIRDTLQMK